MKLSHIYTYPMPSLNVFFVCSVCFILFLNECCLTAANSLHYTATLFYLLSMIFFLFFTIDSLHSFVATLIVECVCMRAYQFRYHHPSIAIQPLLDNRQPICFVECLYSVCLPVVAAVLASIQFTYTNTHERAHTYTARIYTYVMGAMTNRWICILYRA